jgi:integrase
MPSRLKPKWGRVWRYQGARGVVWRIRYRDAAGKRILETLGKEPAWNQTRAEKELRRRLVDVERDGYKVPERLTLRQFAERWQEEYLPGRGLKQTTLDSYRQTLDRHLLPALGHHTLTSLEQNPELIDRYIAQKIQAGLSPKTVTNHLLLLQVMLKRAERWRLIRHNPVSDTDRPRLQQPELNVLTETEIARLWTAYSQLEADAKDDEQKIWWQLARTLTFVALGSALRRGELLALRWKDIHLLDGQLTVREALVKGRFTTPKSRSSRRLIELGPRTKQLLAEHYQHTAYNTDEDLVFAHPSERHAARPLTARARTPQTRTQSRRDHQAVSALPRPPPHRAHPRRRSGQPARLHPNESRPFPKLHHGALYPRSTSAVRRCSCARRGTDVQ